MAKKNVERKAKKKEEPVEEKTFSDLTNKSWFRDGSIITIGDSFSKITSGDSQTLEIKDFLSSEEIITWKILVTVDEKIHLLKSSRELK